MIKKVVKASSKKVAKSKNKKPKTIKKKIEKSSNKDEFLLLNKSQTKRYIKETADLSIGSETLECLLTAVKCLCDKAVERAKENRRKTVLKQDL